MIIKVAGEKPFQALSDSFAVSPSNQGYTLNYSADGKDYTAWKEATPASETLVVNGVAAGMFFKFVGNADELNVTL